MARTHRVAAGAAESKPLQPPHYAGQNDRKSITGIPSARACLTQSAVPVFPGNAIRPCGLNSRSMRPLRAGPGHFALPIHCAGYGTGLTPRDQHQ